MKPEFLVYFSYLGSSDCFSCETLEEARAEAEDVWKGLLQSVESLPEEDRREARSSADVAIMELNPETDEYEEIDAE